MTDQVEQDVALDDNEEVISEMQDPKNAEEASVASVKKAGEAGKSAPARKGDKKNSEKAPAAPKAEGVDFDDDLEALISEEATLSEGFKGKAAIIFEAAINSKLTEEVDRMEAEYAEKLNEETNSFKDELVEKVDGYLNYVVEQWMEENRVAVENGLRTEIAESFMDALKGVFTEHYIAVPESKVDMVDDLAEQVQELEGQLTKATEDNIRLSESVSDFRRAEILAEASKDLAVTEAEKLKTLAEDVDFEDADTFARKVATLKESYFAKPVTEDVEAAEVSMNADNTEEVQLSPIMERYTAALAKSVK